MSNSLHHHLVTLTAVATLLLVGGCASPGGSNGDSARRSQAGHASAPASPPNRGTSAQRVQQHRLGQQVSRIAHGLARQKIMYRQGPGLRDCSGMFHRVLLGLKEHYPGVTLPSARTHRTTRQLAHWYHQRGVLRQPVNARDEDRYIQPGTVMFFGRPGKPHPGRQELFGARGVVHMGIVVDVTRNAAGRVVEYGMFHGRRAGKPAAITRYHKRDHVRYPPYGNGTQPWVAFAPVLGATPAE